MTDDAQEPPDAESIITGLIALSPIEYGQSRKAAAKALGIALGILDKEVNQRRRIPSLREEWTKDLIFTETGGIAPIYANAATALRTHANFWPLRFDEFSQKQFLGDNFLTDADLQRIADWVQHQGILAGHKIIQDAAMYVANANKFHEVFDWLETLKWDGISRCDMLLIDHAGADDTALVRAFTSKWLIQAVARIYDPGCQADATLILEGKQDLGKSSLLRALFGDRWFTDHLPNLDNKDAMIQLLGIWCIEISELAAIGRTDNAKIKQFLTSRDDRFRMPWDRLAGQHPRQSVFAGTVNPGAGGYLKDETGGRRFWPVTVTEVNVDAIRALRPQIWAEAVGRYKAREPWYLTDRSISASAKDMQAARYVSDPWHEPIEAFVYGRPAVTMEELFKDCLSIKSEADWTTGDEMRIGRCMSHLGWEKKQRRGLKGRERYYIPPEDVDEADEVSPVTT